jgi:hypothetical protein
MVEAWLLPVAFLGGLLFGALCGWKAYAEEVRRGRKT